MSSLRDDLKAEYGNAEGGMIKDPKFFNYVIMVLYFLNAIHWAFAKSIGDVCYWLSALAITATVTWLYKH